MKYLENRGITLIALVVTIVILLILAGVTLLFIVGQNGILNRAEKSITTHIEANEEEEIKLAILEKTIQYNETDKIIGLLEYFLKELTSYETPSGAIIKCDSNGIISYNGVDKAKIDENGKVIMLKQETEKPVTQWTQDGQNVTNGVITLKVGSPITGYEANGMGDGKWSVLGAENGNLLIMANQNVEGRIYLGGKEDYINGIAKLNAKAEAYTDERYAEGKARSVTIEDINRVTKYVDNAYNIGSTQTYQSGNEVTYTMLEGTIMYHGTQYPKADKTSDYNQFTYWAESEWKDMGDKESMTFKNTFYIYNNTIPETEEAYNLLFKNTSPQSNSYWLASKYIKTYSGMIGYGLRAVIGGFVSGEDLYRSNQNILTGSVSLRPAVSLKSIVQVSANGALSLPENK